MSQPVRVHAGLTCSGCGYDLRGSLTEGNCPECGQAVVQSIRRWRRLTTFVNPHAAMIGAVLWIFAQALSWMAVLSHLKEYRNSSMGSFVFASRSPVIWPAPWWTQDLTGQNGRWRAAEGWFGIAAAIVWTAACWFLTAGGKRRMTTTVFASAVRWFVVMVFFIGLAWTWWWVPGGWKSPWPWFDRLWQLSYQFDPRNALLGLLIALYLWRTVRPIGDKLLSHLATIAVVAAFASLIGTVLMLSDWPPGPGSFATILYWDIVSGAISCPVFAFLALMVRLAQIARRAERIHPQIFPDG